MVILLLERAFVLDRMLLKNKEDGKIGLWYIHDTI